MSGRLRRQPRPRTSLGAGILVITALACGGDHATAPRPAPPVLHLAVTPSFIGPRETSVITISVTPTTGDGITDAWLRLDGSGSPPDSVTLPLFGDAAQALEVNLTAPNIPLTATLLLTLRVRTQAGVTASASATLSVGDTTPPQAWWTYVGDTVAAGQTATVGAEYSDHSGLSRIELHLTGALTRDDVYDEPTFPSDGNITFQVIAPAQPGDSIVETAIATDMYGLRTSIRQVLHIKSP